jgi:putative long chain acyl-CoA synthase
MPASLWRGVEERFAPARVLEFYASTEAGAILVNLRDVKRGAMGRPLPGSAEVRIAAYDLSAGGLVVDHGGFAKRCGVDEVGMLLARVGPAEPLSVVALRGVFAPEDRWVVTGDLFKRDADGDYWRVDGVRDVIRTEHGLVFTTPIRDALGELREVDLAVAYGVLAPGSEHQLAMAAVTLRAGAELDARELSRTLGRLPEHQRPLVVRVVDQIPVTTWYRPLTGPLREEGIPEPAEGVRAWYLDASGERYRPLTSAARKRLVGAATRAAPRPSRA